MEITKITVYAFFFIGLFLSSVMIHEVTHIIDYKLHNYEVIDYCLLCLEKESLGYVQTEVPYSQYEEAKDFIFWGEVKAYSVNVIFILAGIIIFLKFRREVEW